MRHLVRWDRWIIDAARIERSYPVTGFYKIKYRKKSAFIRWTQSWEVIATFSYSLAD